jgi:hypothetical protein
MPKLTFNASKEEPMEERNFDNIPEGKYAAQIIKSEIKRNSKDTGDRLNFTFKILAGEFKGRQLFVGLNLNHENEQANQISARELKSICDAVGKGQEEICIV